MRADLLQQRIVAPFALGFQSKEHSLSILGMGEHPSQHSLLWGSSALTWRVGLTEWAVQTAESATTSTTQADITAVHTTLVKPVTSAEFDLRRLPDERR